MTRKETTVNRGTHFATNAGVTLAMTASYLDDESNVKRVALTFPETFDVRFDNWLEGIVVGFTGITGSPTHCYFKLCAESECDFSIIGKQKVPLDFGCTDQTKATISERINFPYSQTFLDDQGTDEDERRTFYLTAWLNKGSGVLNSVLLSAGK